MASAFIAALVEGPPIPSISLSAQSGWASAAKTGADGINAGLDAQDDTIFLSAAITEGADVDKGQMEPQPGKSHTDLYVRQLLIDYYTVAFEKKFEEAVAPDAAIPVSAKKRKVLRLPKPVPQGQVEATVDRVQPMLQNIPEKTVAELVDSALKSTALVFDFRQFEQSQREAQKRRRARDDEEVLVLASTF